MLSTPDVGGLGWTTKQIGQVITANGLTKRVVTLPQRGGFVQYFYWNPAVPFVHLTQAVENRVPLVLLAAEPPWP